ncbi:N-acetyltransferase [Peribacillus simplex]|uniref:N-acetyltransferase n=1 Tax=Peribacillus simplex TaxID=1478 RepID=UPI00333CB151
MDIYHAVTSDVKYIYNLIQIHAEQGVVLPRTKLSLYQHLQCMYVMKEDNKILGVAGLHVLGQDLAEVRSLVVAPNHSGQGIGRKLVNHIINQASQLEISRLISLTYETEFFKKCNFEIISKDTLPEKVWIDCMNCPKFNSCDEVAMINYIG